MRCEGIGKKGGSPSPGGLLEQEGDGVTAKE